MERYEDSLAPNTYILIQSVTLGLAICADSNTTVLARPWGEGFDATTHWRLLKLKDQDSAFILKSRTTGGFLSRGVASDEEVVILPEDQVASADPATFLWTPSASNSPQATVGTSPGMNRAGAVSSIRIIHENKHLRVAKNGDAGHLSMEPAPSDSNSNLQQVGFDWSLSIVEISDFSFSFSLSGYTLATLSRSWSTQMYNHHAVAAEGETTGWLKPKHPHPAFSCIDVVDIGSNVIAFGVESANSSNICYGSAVKASPLFKRLRIRPDGADHPDQIKCISTNMDNIFVTDVHGSLFMTKINYLDATGEAWTKLAPIAQSPQRSGWGQLPPSNTGVLRALQPEFAVISVSSFKYCSKISILDRLGFVWFRDISNRQSPWRMVPRSDTPDEQIVISISQNRDGIYAMTDAGILLWTHFDNPQWQLKHWTVSKTPNANRSYSIIRVAVSEHGIAMGAASGDMLIARLDPVIPPAIINFHVVSSDPPGGILLGPWIEQKNWGYAIAGFLILLTAYYVYQVNYQDTTTLDISEKPQSTAKRRALLVSCVGGLTLNATSAIRQMLIDHFGFEAKNIIVLDDTGLKSSRYPSVANFKKEFSDLIASAVSGDIRFLFVDTHGGSFGPSSEPDGKDEYWGLADGLIRDDWVAGTIRSKLHIKASLTIFTPACFSGGILDIGPKTTDGILLSPVAENQTHVGLRNDKDPWTWALLESVKEHFAAGGPTGTLSGPLTYQKLFDTMVVNLSEFWIERSQKRRKPNLFLGRSVPPPPQPTPPKAGRGVPWHQDPQLLFRTGYIDASTHHFLEERS
ncbi:hypothetical protein CcaCcLH18_03438 [Colletotrichum camelliae]|nr:hypothetical protein CcaCcLH18_03438 [Colletotrichum camelliae]